MRPRDPILAFILHGTIAFIACVVGSLFGALWTGTSSSFLRQSLPVILTTAIAGRLAGAWSKSRSAYWIWIPSALFMAWMVLAESTGWTEHTRPAEGVLAHDWNQ